MTRQDSAIVKRAAPHSKTLKTAKLAEGEPVPAAANAALRQVAGLATELLQARSAQESADLEARTAASGTRSTRRTLPCAKYNTWWDAFKTLVGLGSDWEACMCREYGGPYCR